MEEKYCPGLEFRTFVFNKKKQRCTTDDTYSPKSQCFCRNIRTGISENTALYIQRKRI